MAKQPIPHSTEPLSDKAGVNEKWHRFWKQSQSTDDVTAAIAIASSACRAWGYATYSGGTPTLAASYNITSITDTGVGRLTWTIATDLSSANYAAVVEASPAGSNDANDYIIARTAGSAEQRHYEVTTLTDPTSMSFCVFGDI